MLISEDQKPFDSPDYVYELKLDGIRCVAYLDENGADLRNKRNMALGPIFPELRDIYKQVNKPCILDGELVVLDKGKPNFELLQRRALMTDPFRIKIAADTNPAAYVAFDILYYDGKELLQLPLMERKSTLDIAVLESPRLAISRVTEGQGIALYNLAEGMELEGIVAKRRDSYYYMGKRTKDWIKIKYMQEEDLIAAGFIPKGNHMISLVVGKPENGKLRYEGHVTLGVTREKIQQLDTNPNCPFEQLPAGNEDAIWFDYMPLCTVQYMKRTTKGGMRQPVFKGFRLSVLS